MVRARTILAALLTVALAGPAAAQNRKLIGSYKDWDAFVLVNKGKKSCFMVSVPKDSAPKNVRRGKVYITITHRPAVRVVGEISVVTGYPYKPDSVARAVIDGRRGFEMFTSGDAAWAYDPKQDKTMVAAMKRGGRLVIRGVSRRGTKTTDRYSLAGFTAAYKAISAACKISP